MLLSILNVYYQFIELKIVLNISESYLFIL